MMAIGQYHCIVLATGIPLFNPLKIWRKWPWELGLFVSERTHPS